jgi:small subunit ribosomal protein S5
VTERINPGELELKEKVVHINRVAKVLKGGRRFSFNAIVVVGDGNGIVGLGLGKANEVINAIAKGTEQAKKNLIRVSLIKGTIPHALKSKYGAGYIVMEPAAPGTGVIAGGPIRAICEAAGITDILTKSIGSSNPHNVSKATFNGLADMMNAETVARKRGLTVQQVFHG